MKIKKRWIFLLLALALLYYVLSKIGFSKILENLKTADPRFLLLAFFLNLIYFFVWNLKWQILIQRTSRFASRVNFFTLLLILLEGAFVNTVTPGGGSGGEPLRAWHVSKLTGIKKSKIAASIVLDKITTLIPYLVFLAFSLLSVFFFLDIPKSLAIVLEIILIAVVMLILLALFARGILKNLGRDLFKLIYKIFLHKKFSSYESFETYLKNRFRNFARTFKKISRDKRGLATNIIFGILLQLLIFLKTFTLFYAFGNPISFASVVIAITITLLVGAVSIVPGGIGLIETAMIGLYIALGINADIAAVVAIADRVILYFFNLFVGYASLTWLSLRIK